MGVGARACHIPAHVSAGAPTGIIIETPPDTSFAGIKELKIVPEDTTVQVQNYMQFNAQLVDSNDNVYVCVIFNDEVDFNPGSGVYPLNSNGYADLYLSKFKENGAWEWSLGWGGAGLDYMRSICVDAADNIYVGGSFYGQVDFDPGPGVVEYDIGLWYGTYLSKFDQNGNLIWACVWDFEFGYDISTNSDGHIGGKCGVCCARGAHQPHESNLCRRSYLSGIFQAPAKRPLDR